ncbi:MAG: ribosome biogenesis GTPase Der [Candidatus Omnitrophica bacterium]|nr:ribosome biogenesis GTPase Der [Candidatus Omnitrophota bacterium]
MTKRSGIPIICIVGRPNVGKSSLFNLFVGHRQSVVLEEAGTTRDRVEGIADIKGHSFKLVDTGGYFKEHIDEIHPKVKEQIYEAVKSASLVLFVVDSMDGMTPADQEFAGVIRKFNRPVLLVANKSDNKTIEETAVDFYSLGFGEPVAVSCAHHKGIDKLSEIIVKSGGVHVKSDGEENDAVKIAIVGRPNVGKSSLVNNLLKEERVIVSAIPGTTRDSIDTFLAVDGKTYVLIDTAGIRHKRKIKKVVDVFSIIRSKESIKRSDISVLVLDAQSGVTSDDLDILKYIEETGKGCIIAVNKWDLAGSAPDVTVKEYEDKLCELFPKVRNYHIIFVSAKTGKNVEKIFLLADSMRERMGAEFSTPSLNKIFEVNDPSGVSVSRSDVRPNFYYITQTGTKPLEFVFFVNNKSAVRPVHTSFIENVLRKNLPLEGIPIKINFRNSFKRKIKE